MEGFGYVHTPVARGEGKEQTSAKPSDAQFAAGGVSRAIMEGFGYVHTPVARDGCRTTIEHPPGGIRRGGCFPTQGSRTGQSAGITGQATTPPNSSRTGGHRILRSPATQTRMAAATKLPTITMNPPPKLPVRSTM